MIGEFRLNILADTFDYIYETISKGGFIMKISLALLVMLLPVMILIGCSDNSSSTDSPGTIETPAPPSAAIQAEVVNAANDFGIKLFNWLSDEKPTKNVVISPLSVSLAFGMALNGAGGQTYTDMQNALELAGLTPDEINTTYRYMLDFLDGLDPEVILEIANSMWIKDIIEVKKPFIDVNVSNFDTEVTSLPFNNEAVGIINSWVAEKTHDKIKDVITFIAPEDILFLINAVYFKGTWTYEFDSTETSDADFNKIDGSTMPCRMMYQENEFSYFGNRSVQVVDLPYGNGDFSLTFVLPEQGMTIDDIIAALDVGTWDYWIENLATDSGLVYLPKFKIEYETSLKQSLAAMGMGIAFDIFNADFSNIADINPLYISGALHKTFIEVNEQGTEAAAVTVVTFGTTGVNDEDPYFVFNANRPFLIAIRERVSGSILFMGKILEPVL